MGSKSRRGALDKAIGLRRHAETEKDSGERENGMKEAVKEHSGEDENSINTLTDRRKPPVRFSAGHVGNTTSRDKTDDNTLTEHCLHFEVVSGCSQLPQKVREMNLSTFDDRTKRGKMHERFMHGLFFTSFPRHISTTLPYNVIFRESGQLSRG